MGICFSSDKETAKIIPDNTTCYKNPKILKINGSTVKNNSKNNYIHKMNPIRKKKKWNPKSKYEKNYPIKYKESKYKNKFKKEDSNILIPGYIQDLTDRNV